MNRIRTLQERRIAKWDIWCVGRAAGEGREGRGDALEEAGARREAVEELEREYTLERAEVAHAEHEQRAHEHFALVEVLLSTNSKSPLQSSPVQCSSVQFSSNVSDKFLKSAQSTDCGVGRS